MLHGTLAGDRGGDTDGGGGSGSTTGDRAGSAGFKRPRCEAHDGGEGDRTQSNRGDAEGAMVRRETDLGSVTSGMTGLSTVAVVKARRVESES